MIALAVRLDVFAWLALPVVTLLKVHLLYSLKTSSKICLALALLCVALCCPSVSTKLLSESAGAAWIGPGSFQGWSAVLLESSTNKKHLCADHLLQNSLAWITAFSVGGCFSLFSACCRGFSWKYQCTQTLRGGSDAHRQMLRALPASQVLHMSCSSCVTVVSPWGHPGAPQWPPCVSEVTKPGPSTSFSSMYVLSCSFKNNCWGENQDFVLMITGQPFLKSIWVVKKLFCVPSSLRACDIAPKWHLYAEYGSSFYSLLLVCKHIHGAYKTVTVDLIWKNDFFIFL